jgi:DNA-binding FadR family transcriptional regulator
MLAGHNLTQRLRVLLDSGRFPPQARLPTERDLAGQFGVSRSTLRKALGRLEAEGRIWRHVGRGTFAGGRPSLDAPGLARLANRTHPEEVMEVRLLIEPRIAALAARRATAADLAAIERTLRKGESAGDVHAFELWDGAFHRAIAEAAHNALMLGLFDAVNAVRQEEIWGRLKLASLTPARLRSYVMQHHACLAAIRERNAARAERCMTDHLDAVRDNMFREDKARPRPARSVPE